MTVVHQAPAETPAPKEFSRWREPRTLTWSAVALIVVACAIRAWWVAQSWLLLDDFYFTSEIARGMDDTDWYLRIHQGHFMPLSFGLVKIAAEFGDPFSWTIPAIEIIAMQVLAALACWWMLRTAFGNSRAVLVGLGFYLFSPLTMPSVMWWAVAINQLPNQIAFFGLIGSHLRYCRTRQTRWLLLACVFLSIGYLSYAKTGLMVITVAGLTLLWFSFGPPWVRFWLAIRRYWVAWAAYGVLSVVWLAVYLDRTPPVVSVPPSGFLPMAQAMTWESLIPALVGGPWRWTLFGQGPISYVLPPTLGVLLAACAVLTVVLCSWGTRHRSLPILWIVALYLAASAVLVYTGRTVVIGVLGGGYVGQHLQYVSDLAPLLSFTLVALFVPVVGALSPIAKREEPIIRLKFPNWSLLVVAGIFLVGSLWTSNAYAQAWLEYPDRSTTERSVQEIRDQDPVFADVSVPPTILSPIVGDQTLIKNYFAPLGDELRVKSFGNDLTVLDEEGGIVKAGVRSPQSEGLFADPAPVTTCLDVDAGGRWWSVIPPASFGLWLEVVYQADSSTSMTIDVGDTQHVMKTLPGRHRALIATPEPDSTIRMLPESNTAGLCVTSLRFGLLAPVKGSG